MTGESLNYEDILSRWKFNKEQAANDLERFLLREEIPSIGSVARAIVTLRKGWVKCSDRMPDPDKKGTYIVATDRGAVCCAHWYGHAFSSTTLRPHITHWMPMPQPPMED